MYVHAYYYTSTILVCDFLPIGGSLSMVVCPQFTLWFFRCVSISAVSESSPPSAVSESSPQSPSPSMSKKKIQVRVQACNQKFFRGGGGGVENLSELTSEAYCEGVKRPSGWRGLEGGYPPSQGRENFAFGAPPKKVSDAYFGQRLSTRIWFSSK